MTLRHLLRPDHQHQQGRGRRNEVDHRIEHRPDSTNPRVSQPQRVRRSGKGSLLSLRCSQRLNHERCFEAGVGDIGNVGSLRLREGDGGRHPSAVDRICHEDKREDGKSDEPKVEIGRQHRCARHQQHDHNA